MSAPVLKSAEAPHDSKPSEVKKRTPFQKGKFEVKIDCDMAVRAGVDRFFTHEDTSLEPLVAQSARLLHERERMASNDPLNYEEVKEKVRRMVYFMMAKKLSVSMNDDDKLKYEGNNRVFSSQQVTAPVCFVPIIENYGTFKDDGVSHNMIGQQAWTFSYVARAIANVGEFHLGQEQQVLRRTDFFVNVMDFDPYGPLMRLAADWVNAWTKTLGLRQINLGGNEVVMGIPEFGANFMMCNQLLRQLNPPIDVVRMSGISVMLEGIRGTIAGGGLLTIANLTALNELGVKVVSWKRQDFVGRISTYVDEVQVPLRSSMDMTFTTSEVTMLGKEGSSAQLIVSNGEGTCYSAMRVKGDKVTFGWMLPNRSVMLKDNVQPYYVNRESTHGNSLDTYLRSATKSFSRN